MCKKRFLFHGLLCQDTSKNNTIVLVTVFVNRNTTAQLKGWSASLVSFKTLVGSCGDRFLAIYRRAAAEWHICEFLARKSRGKSPGVKHCLQTARDAAGSKTANMPKTPRPNEARLVFRRRFNDLMSMWRDECVDCRAVIQRDMFDRQSVGYFMSKTRRKAG